MTPDPDVTLTVSPLCFAHFMDEDAVAHCTLNHDHWGDHGYRAILAAPMPPPPEPHPAPKWGAIHQAMKDGGWGDHQIGAAMDAAASAAEPAPSPMKEPERGDVVTVKGSRVYSAIVLGFHWDSRIGTRVVTVGDASHNIWHKPLDAITENHGPPEGDTWHGWEIR